MSQAAAVDDGDVTAQLTNSAPHRERYVISRVPSRAICTRTINHIAAGSQQQLSSSLFLLLWSSSIILGFELGLSRFGPLLID